MKIHALLGFPTMLQVLVDDLTTTEEHDDPEVLVLRALYARCVSAGVRPDVVRVLMRNTPTSPFIDVPWMDIVKSCSLNKTDYALAVPLRGKKSRDIDLVETAKFYGVPHATLKRTLIKQLELDDLEKGMLSEVESA
jgi:hypothetical protein